MKKSAQYSLLLKQLEKKHLSWVCESKVVFKILKLLKRFVLRKQTDRRVQIKPVFSLHFFPFLGEKNKLPRFPLM